MIVLLGASGFIGRAFAGELRRRGHCFIPLTRRAFDYTRFNFLFDYLRATKPVFLVNAASYEGSAEARPSARERERMMAANAILPQMIARACLMTKTPWGHVSSGSVYCGAKVSSRGKTQIVRHLGRADLLRLFTAYPERFEEEGLLVDRGMLDLRRDEMEPLDASVPARAEGRPQERQQRNAVGFRASAGEGESAPRRRGRGGGLPEYRGGEASPRLLELGPRRRSRPMPAGGVAEEFGRDSPGLGEDFGVGRARARPVEVDHD